MSVRTPLLLAGSFAVLLGLHLLLRPAPPEFLPERIWPPLQNEEVTRLEIERRDAPLLRIEAEGNPEFPSGYRIVQPIQRPADPLAVQDALSIFQRISRRFSIEATPEALSEFQLDPPLCTVRLVTNRRNMELRIGKEQPARQEGYPYVYCQAAGDPGIHLAFAGDARRFFEPAEKWRSMQVVVFTPHRIHRVAVESRPAPDQPFRRTEVARPDGLSWKMVRPVEDLADHEQVNLLLEILSQLRALRYAPFRSAAEMRLENPWARIELFDRGSSRPISVALGEPFPDEDLKKRVLWVHVGDTDEAALCEAQRIENDLPTQPDRLRPRSILFTPLAGLRGVEIAAPGVGEVRLSLEEKKDEKGGVRRRWLLQQPPGIQEPPGPMEQAQQFRIDRFLDSVRHTEALEFVGRSEQPPAIPACDLVYRRDDGDKTYSFEMRGDRALCYRPSGKEWDLYRVPADLVRMLRRLELNFWVRPALEINPAAVVRIDVERHGDRDESFVLLREDEGKNGGLSVRWKSTLETQRPEETRRLDVEKLTLFLKSLEKLQPERYVSRDIRELKTYGLAPQPAWRVTLHFRDRGRQPITLMISRRFEGDLVFGWVEDRAAVFQLSDGVVTYLERLHSDPRPE